MSAKTESSTSSVTHPLLSTRRSHRRPRPVDEVDEFASAFTVIGEGADTSNTLGPCRLMGTSQLTRTIQKRIKMSWDARHRAVATKVQYNHLVHDIGSIVHHHCPMTPFFMSYQLEKKCTCGSGMSSHKGSM
ncbi:hypothetical protein D8674_008303 [Pyrus ussuriensis x Pyrus communis]|uniref:Uncharacterized protein n=1 Tax=Pyrus ussuriensis x Pyrus communis TaxID=2448454 RepID=A0A5N5I5A0_9ROSA|nr:hypothetical protein D8674_008303 [Pyrus ussuriensis x Pyrus communis]